MRVSNIVLATFSFTVSTYALPAAVEQPAVEARGWDWGFGGGKEEALFSPPAVETKAFGGWGGFGGWEQPAPAPTSSAARNPWAFPTGIWHFPTPSEYSRVPVATTTSKAAVTTSSAAHTSSVAHTSSAASTSTKASTTSHASATSSSAYQHHSPSSKVPTPHPTSSKEPHPHPTHSKESHHPHKPTHTSTPTTTAAPVTTTASSNTAGPTMTMGAKVNLKRVSSPVDNMLIENLAGVF